MNYSIRNLVIAGGLAILAIVAVLIYTSNVKQSAKQGQARVKVYVARVDVPAGRAPRPGWPRRPGHRPGRRCVGTAARRRPGQAADDGQVE